VAVEERREDSVSAGSCRFGACYSPSWMPSRGLRRPLGVDERSSIGTGDVSVDGLAAVGTA
jgi:hypothetical protein